MKHQILHKIISLDAANSGDVAGILAIRPRYRDIQVTGTRVSGRIPHS